jgi:hypothetical protein
MPAARGGPKDLCPAWERNSVSKLFRQWPLLFVAAGLVLTLCWSVLLLWLISGPVAAGVKFLFSSALLSAMAG